jgi:hypothetical protein
MRRRFAAGSMLGILAALFGCGDGDMPTQPQVPFDFGGSWHGEVTDCDGSPTDLSVTFTQSGDLVTGQLGGGCSILSGSTFEGHVDRVSRLVGRISGIGGRYCSLESGATRGSVVDGRLTLDVRVAYVFYGSGGCPGIPRPALKLIPTGTLVERSISADLTR